MKKRGFTLTELLLVIFILGILILIGVPAFRNYQPGMQLSGTLRELISDLRYAQQLAVTEQIDHGIRLLSGDDKYQIIEYALEGEEILQEKSFPSEVGFHQIDGLTDSQAVFNPYGALTGEAGSVTLINSRNETATIDIRPSGFVRIIE